VRGSFTTFAARRLVAVVLTVVLAPTLVWTVFTALRGTGGQSVPGVALDYLVTTYWHFDLGRSSAYSDVTFADEMIASLPARSSSAPRRCSPRRPTGSASSC
jgi:predicted exporter